MREGKAVQDEVTGPFVLLYKIPDTEKFINNRNLLLTALEAGKSTIKAPAALMSGKSLASDSKVVP